MARGVVWHIDEGPVAPPVKCAYPACAVSCPRIMGFCLKHWFVLPRTLRSGIWNAYTRRIAEGGPLTEQFIEAYRAAVTWAIEREAPAQAAMEL
jgi:hypothetical protein